MDMSDLKIDMNDMIMTDSPIRFPGLFGDWTFTASSKAIDVGHGVYWYGILIALGLLLALLLCMKERVKYGISEDNLYDGLLWGIPLGIVGARVYYVLFYLDRFRTSDGKFDFGSAIAFWDGGLAIYGTVIVGILVALCAALLGVPLVLKRYSMIGDGLSHVSFGALSIALACGWAPLPVSIPVVVLAALGLLRMTERSRMGADAAIAVVSASALAVGVVVTSLTTGMTTDVDSFMFGSILAMDRADVALSVGLCAAVLVLYVLFYHRLFAITFDESFARATGVKVGLYNTILSVLTALTIVLGMRMMGAMLISSLVIFPALTAMTLLRSFRGVVICAAGLSVVCFCVGLTGSYLWGTPVGATVVLVNLAVFLLSRGVMKLKRAS